MSNRLYATLFFIVLLTVIFLVVFRVLAPFFGAIAWAFVLASGLHGPWMAVAARFPRKLGLAAALFSVLTGLVVIVPAVALVSVLVSQATEASTKLMAELESRQIRSVSDVISLPVISRALEWVSEKSGVTPEDLVTRAKESGALVSKRLAAMSGTVLKSLLDSILTFLTTIFLLFFFLRDGDQMTSGLTDLVPLPASERTRVVTSVRKMMQAIFRGSLLCALVQGITGAIGWVIAGLPSPVLAGAFMAVLSLLPIGGTALVWAPGAIYLWVSGHHGMAIFLLLWGLIVTSTLADNFLKPILIGGAGTEMDTLVVFIGVFGGISAFGLLGIFIGPISLVLLKTFLDILRTHARLAERPPLVLVEG